VGQLAHFFRIDAAPVNSVLLLVDREEATTFPTGEIALAACTDCGFIGNTAFKSSLVEYYSARYESTQAYSTTFDAFSRRLAQSLVNRYDLHGKTIVEIGCGQGEFLAQLCQLGGSRGIGFDPAFEPTRSAVPSGLDVEVIKDFFPCENDDLTVDFYVCKMTLEHIPEPAQFLAQVRAAIKPGSKPVLFIQVPNAMRALRDAAFWDVYYEHCSYFYAGSLARLLCDCGFDVVRAETAYDDQYLMMEAVPADKQKGHMLSRFEDAMATLRKYVGTFERSVQQRIDFWHKFFAAGRQQGLCTILWGGGSKAVAFLATLGLRDEVQFVVDINPHKHGTYLPGTGHPVIGPHNLTAYRPDRVIAMNSIYIPEIQEMLANMGLHPRILPVELLDGIQDGA
jgi:SAM-dependent methyltransferase